MTDGRSTSRARVHEGRDRPLFTLRTGRTSRKVDMMLTEHLPKRKWGIDFYGRNVAGKISVDHS